ncbi:MAG: hypothetical protein OEW83_17015 [Acidimicrobiia bacterium]|nr:hypothetical protein [Acidimicrobiia bacterium]
MEHTPDSIVEVVWPSVRRGVQAQRRAPRLTSLDGKRVAFLWDYVFRGDELFPILGKELQQRYPAIKIVDYTEFGNLHGSDEKEKVSALPGQLKARRVDAVVSGMGC